MLYSSEGGREALSAFMSSPSSAFPSSPCISSLSCPLDCLPLPSHAHPDPMDTSSDEDAVSLALSPSSPSAAAPPSHPGSPRGASTSSKEGEAAALQLLSRALSSMLSLSPSSAPLPSSALPPSSGHSAGAAWKLYMVIDTNVMMDRSTLKV